MLYTSIQKYKMVFKRSVYKESVIGWRWNYNRWKETNTENDEKKYKEYKKRGRKILHE